MNNKKLNIGRRSTKQDQEACKLSAHYRNEVFDHEVLKLLDREDFKGLIKVAKYAEIGVPTAIETAFCLGYKAGKGRCREMSDERKEVIEELIKEVEGIQNIAKIRFILSIIKKYKKGSIEV